MPQMSPLKWLYFYFFFFMTFILFNIMNYYMLTPILPSYKINKSLQNFSPLNWKW